MTNRPKDNYWAREQEDFDSARAADESGYSYRDWQPTKWQALDRLRQHVLMFAAAQGSPVRSALELGCGSGTLLLQMALGGVRGTGVDRDSSALSLAAASARSHGVSSELFKLQLMDFMTEDFPAYADLVFSIGVIEHFDLEEQVKVLRRHFDFSNSWVLIAVPNLTSPLFQAFLKAKAHDGRLYDEEHVAVDVPALALSVGAKVELQDGCHVFLSKQDDRRFADPELVAFEDELRERMVAVNKSYSDYPRMDLESWSIEVLSQVESSLSREQREHFGFLRWYLLRKATAAQVPPQGEDLQFDVN